MILPVPVTLNRLADPLCVFIFGMVRRPFLPAHMGQRHGPAARVRGGATPPGAAPPVLPGGAGLHVARRRGRCLATRARHLARLRGRLCVALGLALGLLPVRADHHDHVPPVLLRLRLDEAKLGDVVGQLLQQAESEFRPGLLAPPEHDRHLDLVPRLQEPLDVALLGAIVVRVDLRAELDLLDDRLCLVLARFPGLDRGLVLELSVVHKLTDRGPRGRGDLYQIEVCLLSEPERLVDGDDPDLLALRTDQPDLRSADALVDTRFGADVTSTGSSVAAGLSGGCFAATTPDGKAPPGAVRRGATTTTALARQLGWRARRSANPSPLVTSSVPRDHGLRPDPPAVRLARWEVVLRLNAWYLRTRLVSDQE